MVVFIIPRNILSVRHSGNIQDEIENVTDFNIKCEHNQNWRENKTFVYNEVTNKKRSELSIIIIHPDIKKLDGNQLTINDITKFHSFGNGVTTTHIKIKSGEKIPVVYCVFPHSSQSAVQAKLAQLKTICMKT